jgi:hypothetical protein
MGVYERGSRRRPQLGRPATPVCGGFVMTHVGPSAAAAGPPYSRLSTEDDLL